MSDPTAPKRLIGSPPKAGGESLFLPGYTASHALVIGINYAGNANHAIPRLANAVGDAEAIAAQLPRYKFQHIRTLLEQEATCDNIRDALEKLTDSKQVKENDRIFIFYAGHGEFRKVITREGNKERRGYLIPYDDDGKWANRIPMDELRTTWEASPAKHVLVVLDACYSGLANGRRSATNSATNADTAVTRYRARQIITAGTSDETIDDLFYTEDGAASRHSHLTHVLVETLTSGSLPQSESINAETLYEHLRKQIVKASKNRQRPTFGNHGHERGVVLLTRPGANLPGDLYTDLHSNNASLIVAALEKLEREVLEAAEEKFQQRQLTEDGIEEWRGLVANEAVRIVLEQSDVMVLSKASKLLLQVLGRSPHLLEVDNWPSMVANAALRLLGEKSDDVLFEASRRLLLLLDRSAFSTTQVLPELIKVIHDNKPARVEQAATMLVQLANNTATLDASVRQLLAEPERIALETALGQSNNDQLTFSALWALVKFFPEAAMPWLRLRLADSRSSELLQRLAMEHLSAMGGSIDIWLIKQAVERRPLSDTLRYEAMQRLRDLLLRLDQKLDAASRNAALDLLRTSARADANPALRGLAAEALVKLAADDALTMLATALKDPDPEQRRQAAGLLAMLPFTSSSRFEAIMHMVSDGLEQETQPQIRAALLGTFGSLWQQAARTIPAATDLAPYQLAFDTVQRTIATLRAVQPALESISDTRITTRLVTLVPPLAEGQVEMSLIYLNRFGNNLTEAQEVERNAALQDLLAAAREQGDPAFLPLLRSLFSNPPDNIEITDGTARPQVAFYLLALEALGTFPRALALPLAQEQLDYSLSRQQSHGPVLIRLIGVFIVLGGTESLAALLRLLQSEAAEVRQAAANALLRLLPVQPQVSNAVREELEMRKEAETDQGVKATLEGLLRVIG